MSSLQDPFDLLKTGAEMDNVVPFLAPNKVNQMIEAALAKPQLAPQRRNTITAWKFTGMGLAACLALLMVFAAPQMEQIDQLAGEQSAARVIPHQEPEAIQISMVDDQDDSATTFSDFVMLETLEPY